MPKRIEIPDEFPAVGDVSGKRVVLTGAGRGLGEFVTGTVLNVDGGYLLA